MIEFAEAGVVAPGGARLLHPTTLALSEARVSIVGANGSGKSTLARLINALTLPSEGSVAVRGNDTKKRSAAVRRDVGFLFTDPTAQLIMPTTIEDVELSLRRVVRDKRERRERAREILAEYGLDERADVPVHALSGGQKQLLALAGVLAIEPAIVVADEPTTLLDLRWREVFDARLDSLDQQVIEVTHDLNAAARADRCLVVHDGAVAYDGPPADAIDFYRDLVATHHGSVR